MSRTFTIFSKSVRPEIKPVEFQETWKEYSLKDVKRSTGKGEDDFEIEQKEIIEEVDINKHIHSFKDEVGVRNIMKRIALTGDASLLEQAQVGVGDLSTIPDLPQEKIAAYKSVEEAYLKIDPALRGSMTMEDFIKGLSEEKIKSYIDAKFASSMNTKKEEAKE